MVRYFIHSYQQSIALNAQLRTQHFLLSIVDYFGDTIITATTIITSLSSLHHSFAIITQQYVTLLCILLSELTHLSDPVTYVVIAFTSK